MVTLTGLRWRGHTGGTYRVGRLSPSATFDGRPRRLKESYHLREFSSQIDGLKEFTNLGSVDVNKPRYERGTDHCDLEALHSTSAGAMGGTRTKFGRARCGVQRCGQSFDAKSHAFLTTTRAKGDTPERFLMSQWPMRALLVLAFGNPLYWREHSVVDDNFPTLMLSGDVREPIDVAVQLQRTTEDSEQPPPNSSDLMLPMFTLR